MRLEKIKLAGFKSFVDPTTVPFPSALVGVVGPNGCGKSNVIDAVRWVMGESSAKMLRGESMADVIFNGSSARKPVGVASVELVFDNSDGKAGGQYAQYSTISVRRQVSREGQSTYFLNGVRCRRRDITDLFLGTGLGPRSYAIIEQGMISRIIESRPEELRVYLEEAAGISKYKERRRETENRIRHTRDNLERLTDLRDEIEKQLRHLERQAATAEKYKTFKAEERQVNAELLLLRLRDMEQEQARKDRRIAEEKNRFEKALANQRRVESEIEAQREAHNEANEVFNEVQGRFYAAGADIARLEEAIQYARESRQRNEAELLRARQALDEARAHRSQDEGKLQEMAQTLMQDQPELEMARARAEELAERQAAAEQAMQAWQGEWDSFNATATEPAQTAQVERTLINQLEQQEKQLKTRLARLEDEQHKLADLKLQAEIGELEAQEEEKTALLEELREGAEEVNLIIGETRTRLEEQQQSLAGARSELETARGRLASLRTLQQAAMGDDDEAFSSWLEATGLKDAPRILEQLQVEPRWQQAVEAVLADQLQGLLVDNLESLSPRLASLESGHLNLMETGALGVADIQGTLASVVEGPDALRLLLGRVRLADDLDSALRQRGDLSPGEMLVTPEGICLGNGWLRLERGDASAGILAREQEIRELAARVEELEPRVEQLNQQLADDRRQLAQQEQRRTEQQHAMEQAGKEVAAIQAQLSGKRARADHIRQRMEGLAQDMQEIRQQLEQDKENMEQARQRLHRALEQMEIFSVQREQLAARRERLQKELADARETSRQARSEAHQIALRVESMRSSEQSLRDGIERAAQQLAQYEERCRILEEQMEKGSEPLQAQQQELEALLQKRVGVEAELKTARQQLESIDHRLRELDKERHEAEQQVQEQRDKLNQANLSRQEVVVRITTLEEQLQQTGKPRAELEQGLPEDADIHTWKERSGLLARRIQRLGAINLAAIDEFREQKERMEYIDAQHADVTKSLETLEEAIRKIDRETRTRFKETFDKVNGGLKAMFPKLFGGGHAYLEMVGEDPLDAGVAIMARPPGKRNSSIHLLSGGEKALSAVALVFSIFQLNPAPFCMLDEVDAPLDDANVGRFCELVKEMSDTVQFIFITHNKVTMAISNQLLGVTMNEPGVSRLVSVDVEEAAQMAAM
ncbi:chromosome segregation protein SMC [Thiolapillus brandeum]|uniref:Chromosome partition protein Smc n=1 Tax=Thiolapillus brandeum TaxID=1076588 RepID=A0A7U6GI76_9GAMM|nr:chromosome segregation protein SMC [Thiolapillus brandeum]BAO44118.1 chromosome segregation protein [Thiolapillus brandeum]